MKTMMILISSAPLFLSGCTSVQNTLIFGKVDKLGVSASGSIGEQGASLTVGYRSSNLAIVPVVARNPDGSIAYGPDGTPVQLGEAVGAGATQDKSAFSTFAHFEAAGSANTGATACLGDTFATGEAAIKVSEKLTTVCK